MSDFFFKRKQNKEPLDNLIKITRVYTHGSQIKKRIGSVMVQRQVHSTHEPSACGERESGEGEPGGQAQLLGRPARLVRWMCFASRRFWNLSHFQHLNEQCQRHNQTFPLLTTVSSSPQRIKKKSGSGSVTSNIRGFLEIFFYELLVNIRGSKKEGLLQKDY